MPLNSSLGGVLGLVVRGIGVRIIGFICGNSLFFLKKTEQ